MNGSAETQSYIQPDAVIYLSGLGRGIYQQSVDDIAVKLTAALDAAADAKAEYRVSSTAREIAYGNGHVSRVRSIERFGSDGWMTALDLYEMDYIETLTGQYRKHNILVRAFLTTLQVISTLPRLVRFFLPRKPKKFGERLQTIYVGMVSFVVTAYAIFLLLAVVALVVKALSGLCDELPDQQVEADFCKSIYELVPSPVNGVWNWINDAYVWLLGIFSAATALGLFGHSLSNDISETAVESHCAFAYLAKHARRDALSRQFFSLLEVILREGPSYRRKHLVSFSFGSIVALDCLFRGEQADSDPAMQFDSLITIGCVFDMVRSLIPNYFTGRRRSNTTARRWINLYLRYDIFGSEISEGLSLLDTKSGNRGVTPIVPQNVMVPAQSFEDWTAKSRILNPVTRLLIPGLLNHLLYWNPKKPEPGACFEHVAAELRP